MLRGFGMGWTHFLENMTDLRFCCHPSSTHNHPDHHPGGNHVADVAEDYEYMEDGVDVGDLLETIQYGSGDVCYALADNP